MHGVQSAGSLVLSDPCTLIFPTTMDYAPLLADGFQEIGIWQLDQCFLEPFKESYRRLHLIRQLSRFLNELQKLGIPLEVWIDGSFTTRKPEPKDVDIVVWVNLADAEALDSRRLLLFDQMLHIDNHERVKILYDVDVNLANVGNTKDHAYWLELFGSDRSKLNTKGIYTLSLAMRHV